MCDQNHFDKDQREYEARGCNTKAVRSHARSGWAGHDWLTIVGVVSDAKKREPNVFSGLPIRIGINRSSTNYPVCGRET
jgi:hypothetical protein